MKDNILDGIEPKNLEQQTSKDAPEIPEVLDTKPTPENNYGINETNDVLGFFCVTGKAIKTALADDNQITLGDAFKFMGIPKAAYNMIKGLANVPSELDDIITDEEKLELKKTVIESGVLEDDAENAVMEGIDLGVALRNYIYKYFINA